MMKVAGAFNPVVMLVEDYDDARQVMRRLLEVSGCRVLEATNGEEAIGLSQRESLDLILMDLNMPVLDGFTATLRIREYERTRDVPVVAVTAYDTAEFRAAAGAVGCCEYIVKPLDFDRLAALIRRYVPVPRAAQLAHAKAE
jgi:two-component system cell cycle response regulator DivK